MTQAPKIALMLGKCPLVLDNLHIAEYPKLMLPVANRPILEYQAAVMADAGVKRLVICLYCVYSFESERDGNLVIGPIPKCEDVMNDISEHMNKYSMEVEFLFQGVPRGTGGTLKEAEKLIGSNCFWLFSTDLFLSGGLDGMAKFHRRSGATASVGAVRIEEAGPEMERIEMDAEKSVKTIHRIHPAYSRRSQLRPVGLYLFEGEVLKLIPYDKYFDIKEQLFSLLYSHSFVTKVWEIQEYCENITSLHKYFKVNRDVLHGRVEFPDLPLPAMDERARVHGSALFGRATVVSPVVVGKDCTLADEAILIGPTSIGDSCTVENEAIVNTSIVLDGCHIGQNARLTKCFLGEGAVVEAGKTYTGAIIVREPLCRRAAGRHASRRESTGEDSVRHMQGVAESGKAGYLFLKRTMDIIFSSVALIAAAPILSIAAVAIKMDSPGRIIFRQKRCGQYGVEFTMYKLRSMSGDSEDMKLKIQYLNEVDGPMFKILHDPRITRVGRILRLTNLDEVPQFYNVLRGDMTLVGPRPLSWDEMAFNPQWRDTRLAVKPGLTGLWQIKSHDKTSFAEWIQYDATYIEERSLWLDMKILHGTLAQCAMAVLERFKRSPAINNK